MSSLAILASVPAIGDRLGVNGYKEQRMAEQFGTVCVYLLRLCRHRAVRPRPGLHRVQPDFAYLLYEVGAPSIWVLWRCEGRVLGFGELSPNDRNSSAAPGVLARGSL